MVLERVASQSDAQGGQDCSTESCRRAGLLLHGGNCSAEGLVVGKFVVSLEAHRSRCGRRGRFPVGCSDVSSWPDLGVGCGGRETGSREHPGLN